MGLFKTIMTPVAEGFEGSISVTTQLMQLFANRIYEFNNGKRKFLKNRPMSSAILGLSGLSGSLYLWSKAVLHFGTWGLATAPVAIPVGFAGGIGFMAALTAGVTAYSSFQWGVLKSLQSKILPKLNDKMGFMKIYEAPKKTYDNDVIRFVDDKLTTRHAVTVVKSKLSKLFSGKAKPAANQNEPAAEAPKNKVVPKTKM